LLFPCTSQILNVENDRLKQTLSGLEQGTFYEAQVIGIVDFEENIYESPAGEAFTTTSEFS